MTIILFIYGACIGSWLTAMADRYATGASYVYPASHCTTCQTPLAYWQLVPVFSYLTLRGRCHYCQASIPATTFLLEVATGIVLTSIQYTTVLPFLWLGLWTFAALCDARTQTFPAWVSYLAMGLALWHQPATTLVLGVLLFACIRLLWPRWSHPLIGDGDLDMLLSYGVLWGVTASAQWLLVASGLALLYPGKRERLPFLPFLVLSAVGWWLWR